MEADDLQSSEPGVDATRAARDHVIADRLDALEAERVLQRALELEAESLDQPHVITTEQLERVAREIGVDAAFVQQALGEIRLEPAARGWFARTVLPKPLFETATITGLGRQDVDAAISKWMTQNEGLTPGGILADGVDWDVDRRWRVRMLSRSLSGGNRISRVASGDVQHRVYTNSEDDHTVAFESQGRLPLFLASVLIGAGSLVAALAMLGASLNGDYLAGLFVSFGVIALSTGIGVAGARWWARGIRGALRRSLVGLVGSAKAKRKRWFQRRRRAE